MDLDLRPQGTAAIKRSAPKFVQFVLDKQQQPAADND